MTVNQTSSEIAVMATQISSSSQCFQRRFGWRGAAADRFVSFLSIHEVKSTEGSPLPLAGCGPAGHVFMRVGIAMGSKIRTKLCVQTSDVSRLCVCL